MRRKIMSIILGVMVFGLLAGALQASQYDPEHPGSSNTRYENSSVIHSSHDEIGWGDPHTTAHSISQRSHISNGTTRILLRISMFIRFQFLPWIDHESIQKDGLLIRDSGNSAGSL